MPKIGLCLSGGGAKGLAHIGLLKLIDSLGIKIDYIVGTSMGSVIGGLYAIGYTGKQIDSIAHNADWDFLLSQYVPMNQIYIDEKDEYDRYIGEIPINNHGKIQLTGLIEGQSLLNFFIDLTKHVNHITDFSQFPIPYKCMAVDIVTVEPYLIDHGNLAMAMRASMSIPTIFKPVHIDERLLVDGGLMVNFPVTELKEMGADIVIGSYTGGRLMDENEMNTIHKLLIQSSTFYGINECKDDIELCNVFNNLTDHMKKYAAGDFKKAKKIIEAGNRLAYDILPELMKIADKQKAAGINYHKPPYESHLPDLKVNDIIIDTLYSRRINRFVHKRITFKKGDLINYSDLAHSVRKIYGTRNFFKVYYLLEPQQRGSYNVRLKVEQDLKFRFKGALHYDNELGAGFIFNITARNLLGKVSRLSATVDLAESPKYKIHYRKYIMQSNLSLNMQLFMEKNLQHIYDERGKVSDSFFNLYNSFNIGFNYNIAMPVSLYAGAVQEYARLTPRFNTNYLNGRNYKRIEDYTTSLIGQFRFNTLDHNALPKRGTEIVIEDKLAFFPVEESNFYFETIDSMRNFIQRDTFANVIFEPYNKFSVKVMNLLPVGKKWSILTNFNAGLMYGHVFSLDSVKFRNAEEGIPLSDYFVLGGVEQRSRPYYIPFWGLSEGEVNTPNYTTFQIGFQYEAFHKFFISPSYSILYAASTPEYFFNHFDKITFDNVFYIDPDTYLAYASFYSYGLNLSYRSPIGPIKFNVSDASIPNHNWGIYFSVGYRF